MARNDLPFHFSLSGFTQERRDKRRNGIRFQEIRKMRLGSFPLAVFIAAGFADLHAEQPPAKLDQDAVHAASTGGDFEKVIGRIDAFTRSHPSYSRDDSIFIAKHLAVVYAADPATREKGKHYMFLLLELAPSAAIVDMFVSDEIDRIFERVKEEFAVRQRLLEKKAASAKPASGSKALYWTLGGTALVAAAGAVTYFILLQPHPTSKDTVYDIPH